MTYSGQSGGESWLQTTNTSSTSASTTWINDLSSETHISPLRHTRPRHNLCHLVAQSLGHLTLMRMAPRSDPTAHPTSCDGSVQSLEQWVTLGFSGCELLALMSCMRVQRCANSGETTTTTRGYSMIRVKYRIALSRSSLYNYEGVHRSCYSRIWAVHNKPRVGSAICKVVCSLGVQASFDLRVTKLNWL